MLKAFLGPKFSQYYNGIVDSRDICGLERTRFPLGYIVGSRGSSQLGGSLLGIPLGYKANKLIFA